MCTLPLNKEQQHSEWQQILHIAHNNNFLTYLLTWLKLRIQQSMAQPTPPILTPPKIQRKWATFTYTSPQIKKVTNIFKYTNIRIAFKCNNTLARLSKPTNNMPPSTPYDKGGTYPLSCITCNKELWAKLAAASSSATRSTYATSSTTTRNLPMLFTADMNVVPLKEQLLSLSPSKTPPY